MKNKLLKRIGLLSISVLTTLAFITSARAEEVCEEYTNYYFFNEIYRFQEIKTKVENDGKYFRSHRTYLPALPSGAKITSKDRVCLSKDNVVDGDTCVETKTLEYFYETYRSIMTEGTKGTFKSGDEEAAKYTVLEKETTKYYLHGAWFEVAADGTVSNSGTDRVDYSSIGTSTLIKGSFLPEITSINEDSTNSQYIKFSVDRTIKAENYSGVEGFTMKWRETDAEETEDTVLAPAMYRIVYNMCSKKYNATINYLDKETKKEVHDPYKDSKLDDGYTKPVDSPEITGCTPDKETVEIKINGKDFEETVYYSCKTETIKDNPKTGSALIFTAWTIGIGALGYSAYYFSKMRKEKETGNDEE